MSNELTGMLHHVEIYVSDLSRSDEFWGWLLGRLGYTLFQRWDGGRSWRIGDTYLVFVQTEERYLDPPYHRRRVGLNHLAFHAPRELIDEITAELRDRGVEPLYPDRHPYASGSYYSLFFEDPDRIKVELAAAR